MVSKVRGAGGPIPPYVSIADHRRESERLDPETPACLGAGHQPLRLDGQIAQHMNMQEEMTVARLRQRRSLRWQRCGHRRHVLCLDRESGKIMWQKNYEPVLPEADYATTRVSMHG